MELKAFRVTYLTKYGVLVSHIVIARDWGEVLLFSVKRFSTGADPIKSLKTIELLDDEPIIEK